MYMCVYNIYIYIYIYCHCMCSTLRLNEEKVIRAWKNIDEFSLAFRWSVKSRKIKMCCDWMVRAMKSTKLFVHYFMFLQRIIVISDWRGSKNREKENQNSFPGKQMWFLCDFAWLWFFFSSLRFERNSERMNANRNSWVFPGNKKNDYLHIYIFIYIYIYMYIYINQNTIFVSVALWWIFW